MMEQDRVNPDELIYIYTAEQAVVDGVLLDVDRGLIQEAGYRWPVRITPGVACLVQPTKEEERLGQSTAGRLWDVLFMARIAILNAEPHEHIMPFDVILGEQTVSLWACLDGTSGPAIHIIRPDEY
jgi:hypothetical protein